MYYMSDQSADFNWKDIEKCKRDISKYQERKRKLEEDLLAQSLQDQIKVESSQDPSVFLHPSPLEKVFTPNYLSNIKQENKEEEEEKEILEDEVLEAGYPKESEINIDLTNQIDKENNEDIEMEEEEEEVKEKPANQEITGVELEADDENLNDFFDPSLN